MADYPNFGAPTGTQTQGNRFSVSTGLVTIFDEDSTLLKLSAMDSALSISIWCPQRDNPNGKNSYPKELRHNLLLTYDRVAVLYDKIINQLLPRYQEGKPYSVGVFTNKTRVNLFEVAVTSEGKFEIHYYEGIGEDRRCARPPIGFKFGKTEILSNYNAADGTFEYETVDGYFSIFTMTLGSFAKLGANATAGHSSMVANQDMMKKIQYYLESFASKFQILIPDEIRTGRSWGPSNNATTSNPATSVNTPVQEIGNLADFMMQ